MVTFSFKRRWKQGTLPVFRDMGLRVEAENREVSLVFLPIWGDYMQKAIMSLPAEDFTAPENVSFVLINPRTGKLAREDTAGAVMECFIKGTEPTEYD